MGKLKDHLNPETKTVQAIYDYHKRLGDSEPKRGYLGASIIGHGCDRYLWYTFRGCVKRDFSGRLYRLFETGDLEEPRFVKELREIGCTVHDVDENGEQFVVHALGGHFSGHMDGCALGVPEAPKTWHVTEFKTSAAKYFAKLIKSGVQAEFPTHYGQMQAYMGLTKMKRALYLARNKDTDHLYSERVKFMVGHFDCLMARAEKIIRTNKPPERAYGRSDDYRCRYCDAHNLCWGNIDEAAVNIPHRNCETCCHSTPELDGAYKDSDKAVWTCNKQNREITITERANGCDGHLLLPSLVWFADPVDACDDWIEFENHADKARWRHGWGEGLWSTEELMRSPGVAVGSKAVEAVKDAFGGTVDRTSLVSRYDAATCERLWDGKPENIREAMDKLDLTHPLAPDSFEEDNDTAAYEYRSDDGENDVCVVVYKKDDYAAIWKGKI